MATGRRSVRGLLLSWAAYWVIAGAVKLGPPALAIYRATRGGGDNTSSVNLGASNFLLSLVVKDHGVTTWSGSAHLFAIALWIAGVPLALWIAWLVEQRGGRDAPAERQRV